jgi:uncharacterized membrane protein YtjA (UPF0391 family)
VSSAAYGGLPVRRKRRIIHPPHRSSAGEIAVLYYAIVFLIVALIAGVLGFGGIAGTAAGIAKILFLIFLVLFLVSFFLGRRRPSTSL